jgi:hypothetical protein
MDSFKFDKRALERVANEAFKKRAAEMQRVFDAVHRSCAGRPVEEVRTALAAACRRNEMTPEQAQLDAWSTTISEGSRIVLQVQQTRL